VTLYLDSSAIVKLVQREAESDALRRYLRRHRIGMIRLARRQLARLYLVPLHRNLLDEAAEMGDVVLRSLDAVHLASAAQLGAHLRAVVTYDTRMQTAAARLHSGRRARSVLPRSSTAGSPGTSSRTGCRTARLSAGRAEHPRRVVLLRHRAMSPGAVALPAGNGPRRASR
jgi:predicted nucleic acid-binding protein